MTNDIIPHDYPTSTDMYENIPIRCECNNLITLHVPLIIGNTGHMTEEPSVIPGVGVINAILSVKIAADKQQFSNITLQS